MTGERFSCQQIGINDFDTMPYRFANSIEIDVSADQLFDSLECAEDWPLWASAITNVTWTSPKPFQLGTTRTVEMTGGMTGYEEFIAWDRGKRMAFRFNEATMKGMDAFGEDYIVEKTTTGVKLTWIMVLAPSGINKWVMPLTKPIMGLVFKSYLKKLKKLLETRHASN